MFTSVLLFGSAAGTLTVALDALVISFWSYRKGHPPYKIVFNVCALPLTIWIAAHLFFLFPSIEPLVRVPSVKCSRFRVLLGPLLAIHDCLLPAKQLDYHVRNFSREGFARFGVWRETFSGYPSTTSGRGSVAALLVRYTTEMDFTVLGIVVPLLLVLLFNVSRRLPGRVEDANAHLTQLNTLYCRRSRPAMAIDAKDQITHGHIRRVQRTRSRPSEGRWRQR